MAERLTSPEEELEAVKTGIGQLQGHTSSSLGTSQEHGFRPTFLPEEQQISLVNPCSKSNNESRTGPVVVNFALLKSQNLKPTCFESESQDSASSDPETQYANVSFTSESSKSVVEHCALQKEASQLQSSSDQISEPAQNISQSKSRTNQGITNAVSEVGSKKSLKESHNEIIPKRRGRKPKGLITKYIASMLKCSKDKESSPESSNPDPQQTSDLDLRETDQFSAEEWKSKSSESVKNPVITSILHSGVKDNEKAYGDIPVDLCSKAEDVHVELVERSVGAVPKREKRPSRKMVNMDSGPTCAESGSPKITEEKTLGKFTSGDSKPGQGQRRKKKRKLLGGKLGEGATGFKTVITRGLVMEGGGLGVQAAPGTNPKQKRYRGKQTVFCCSLCPKTFPLNCRLTKHLKTHAGIKPFMCTECGNCFTQNSSLQKHMRTHTGEKPYECPECHRTFSESGTLVRHRRTHTGFKPYPCPHCTKRFAQKNSLKIHIRSHTGERPHKCPRCPKSFARLRYLSTHIRIHTGDKPFKCPECFKPFAAQSNLKSHMITHSGEKPHVCEVCNKCFSHKKTLQHHTRTHFEEDPFACRVCGKVFAYASSLHKHMKSHGPSNQFFCTVCERSFCDNFSLKGHMRTHSGEAPFTCSVCGKGLYYRSSLKKHLQRHNETPEEKVENVCDNLS